MFIELKREFSSGPIIVGAYTGTFAGLFKSFNLTYFENPFQTIASETLRIFKLAGHQMINPISAEGGFTWRKGIKVGCISGC